MPKKIIKSHNTAPPTGNYSVCVRGGDFLFIAGTGPRDAKTLKVSGNVEEQTAKTLENIRERLKVAGATLDDIVSINVYLKDIDDWGRMNKVYGKFFKGSPPARTTLTTAFSEGMLVEMNGIAYKPLKR